MADALWSSVAILSHLDGTDGTTVNLGYLGGAPGIGFGVDNLTNQKFGAACAQNFVSINSDFTNAGISTAGIDMSGDFVIEGWIRPDDLTTQPWLISFNDEDVGETDYSDHVLSVTTVGAVTLLREIYDFNTEELISSTSDSSSSGVITEGVYHHVAIQRASGTLVVAIDGASVISVSDTRDYSNSFFVSWGDIGFIDEVRLTTASRYTFPFAPPTAAFETDGGAGPTTAEGDGTATGTTGGAIVGASRAGAAASAAGVGVASADAVDKTPRADGVAASAGTAQGHIANSSQTSGWSQVNRWPHASWTLSPDDKTATLAPTVLYDEIRGVRGKSTGKWYFEIGTSAVSSKGVGITQTDVALGAGAPPVRFSSGTVSTWGFAFDADALEYWVRFNGAWNDGGPGASAPDGTLLPGTQVPFADHSATSGSGQTYVARFTELDLLSAPPAGFTPIDDEPGNAGTVAGTSVALGAGSAGTGGAGTSTGSSTATGPSVNGRVGSGAAIGTATASAQGIPATARNAASTAAAAVTGLARSVASTTASSAGSSIGTARMLYEITGSIAGAGTVSAAPGGRTKFRTGHTATSKVSEYVARGVRPELVARTSQATYTSLARPAAVTASTEASTT